MKGKLFIIMAVLLVISYFLYEYRGDPRKLKAEEPKKFVSGIITDTQGNKVQRATVYLLGADVKTGTNDDGEYKIEGAVVGDELVITHSKYKKKIIEIKSKTENNIVLEPEGQSDPLLDQAKKDFPDMDIQ